MNTFDPMGKFESNQDLKDKRVSHINKDEEENVDLDILQKDQEDHSLKKKSSRRFIYVFKEKSSLLISS